MGTVKTSNPSTSRIRRGSPDRANILVHFLCAPKENEPKERAPCHLVLRTTLRFSKRTGAAELPAFGLWPSAGQTVLALVPSVSVMLGCVTTGRGTTPAKRFRRTPASGGLAEGTRYAGAGLSVARTWIVFFDEKGIEARYAA
jgi:hypothetical protein